MNSYAPNSIVILNYNFIEFIDQFWKSDMFTVLHFLSTNIMYLSKVLFSYFNWIFKKELYTSVRLSTKLL